MSKIDDLVKDFEAETSKPIYSGWAEKKRAGIAAVIRALRDEIVPERMRITRANDTCTRSSLRRYFNEILGDAGEKATTDAIQSFEGEEANGLRRSIEIPESGAESCSGRLEREGDVCVPRSGKSVQGESSPASRHLPRGYRDKLSPAPRHESSERGHRSLDSSSVGHIGGRLGDGHGVAAAKAAGTVTVAAEAMPEAIERTAPAAAPAPVCEWAPRRFCWETSCGRRPIKTPIAVYPNCSCGRPIKFTEAK